MKNRDVPGANNGSAIPRRSVLTRLASAGAALGMGSAPTIGVPVEQEKKDVGSLPPVRFGELARLRDYRNRRASSFDKTGGNADFVRIEPGQTVTLLDASGPGIVTHIWFTINSDEEFHLK